MENAHTHIHSTHTHAHACTRMHTHAHTISSFIVSIMLLVSSILPFTTTGSLSGTFSLLKSNWKREREREERGREAVKGGGWLSEAREEGRKERGRDRGRKEVKEDTEGKLSMTPWHCEGGRRDVMLTPSPCLSHSNYTKVSIPLHINIALQSYCPPPPSIPHSQVNLHKTMATDKQHTALDNHIRVFNQLKVCSRSARWCSRSFPNTRWFPHFSNRVTWAENKQQVNFNPEQPCSEGTSFSTEGSTMKDTCSLVPDHILVSITGVLNFSSLKA